MNKVIQGSIATAAAIIFTACGSGGDSTSSTTTTGVFVDSAVSGLSYTCSSGATGTTNNLGQFTCNNGDTVSFFLGGYSIGSCTIGTTVSPRTLYPNDDAAVINIAQLLQTIDDDNDPSNGITIPDGFSALNGITITPDGLTFDDAMATALNTTLVTEEAAAAHLNETLSELGLESYNATISDIAGHTITFDDGSTRSYYSNMTVLAKSTDGNVTGTWSVENGVLIEDITYSPAEKATISVVFSKLPAVGNSVNFEFTQTGNYLSGTSKIISIQNISNDIVPLYTLTYADLAGKQLLTGGETIYFFNNMTSTQDIAANGSGVWTIENGVLIHDITTFTNSTQGTETTAVVFNGAPDNSGNVTFTVYETYADGSLNDSFIVSAGSGVLSDINITDTNFGGVTAFDNNPVPYNITLSEVAGKVFVVAVGAVQQNIYFYDNMTYKIEFVGLGEVLTGTWSLENGVVIADVSMGAAESEQRVYVFDIATGSNTTFTNYLTLAADPVKETGSIISISNIQ